MTLRIESQNKQEMLTNNAVHIWSKRIKITMYSFRLFYLLRFAGI